MCGGEHNSFYFEDKKRTFYKCETCALVFVPPRFYVDSVVEKKQYDNHKNSIEDEGYCHFLTRLIDPMEAKIPKGSYGLDFGSGPGPTLSELFKRRGFEMDIYDPYYAPNDDIFSKKYQFITSTEVIEHMYNPMFEVKRLLEMLEEGGVLGLMTMFVPENKDDFKQWFYKNDPTHIAFYSEETFQWLACYIDAKLDIVQRDVVLLQKTLY